MNINKLTNFIAVLMVMAAFSFASGTANAASDVSNLSSRPEQNATSTADIPWSVLEPNFRIWEPQQPVPMYQSFAKMDLAWTDGSVIFYNPQLASQVPPKVFAFVVAHEYGHIYQRSSNEIASDQFAARAYAGTDMSVVYAAIWHMANVQPFTGDATHPIGLDRALIIGQAAGLSQMQIQTAMQGAF